MKKITTILLSSLFMFVFSLNAQESLVEGSISMEITDVASDNEQAAAGLEMMKGAVTTYVFDKDQSYVSANMMGGMIVMKSLFNNSSEDMVLLFDMMGQKMMIESSKEERKESEMAQKEAMEGLEITYDETDTKEILGYKCISAKMMDEENGGMGFKMYVTADIKASNRMIQGMQGFDLKGFPLEYVMMMGPGTTMTYTATELKKEIDKSVFELNTAGYTKMTFEEFTEQMGAMGGGMGF